MTHCHGLSKTPGILRTQTDLADVPEVPKGAALVFIVAGSLSLAFMGFAGLVAPT